MSSERARIAADGSSTRPLASALRDDLGEARVQRMWQRIDHAPARRSGVSWMLASAAAVTLLLLGVTNWLTPRSPGQLALASGPIPVVLSAAERAEASRFDDGSQLVLERGSRVEILRNDARSFVTALRRGDVTFDVKPGGKRHWVIEAGEISVEVVGTRFRVERFSEVTRVSVQHGVVLVRGERVSGGVVRLTAGQRFELSPPSPPAPPLPPVVERPVPSAVARAEPSRDLSGTDRPPRDLGNAVDVVAQELAAADEARQRGDTAAATQHFEAAFAGAPPGDARRGLSALSLARLLRTGNPSKAAQVLRSSLPDMPAALREDAQARLVEAESRAGNQAGALRAAEEYKRRFPAGHRLREVERWSQP